MKTKLIIVTIIAAIAGVALANMKCPVCKGTGWDGQRKCQFCGGDGNVGQ